jgi:hypothetical protein
MNEITIKIKYPENANLEDLANQEEEFARYMESSGCTVEFSDILEGSLPRPRKPKKE